ncbi:ganglioside GM2 activator-like isoform X2 [Rhopilema esculentum]|uniref:ganglioside GM2 activator-like isoform X2 n=1 Tax=Rhopilema esculentum TaxID=499914 RepID=UPI0031E47614
MASYLFIISAIAALSGLGYAVGDHCDSKTIYPLQVLVRKLPDPLVVKEGEKFNVSLTIKVRRKLPKSFEVDLDLWKKIGFWIKIPCISEVGSCDYKFDCQKMNCTQYLDMCTSCKIAVDDVTITVPVNVDFPSFLVNGKYWIGYKIKDGKNGSFVACGEQYINIEI